MLDMNVKPVKELCCVAVLVLSSCQSNSAPRTAKQPAATQTVQTSQNQPSQNFEANGLKISLPGGWDSKPNQGKDAVLSLVASKQPQRKIVLDVPHLPPHIPGLIPMGAVESGYIDDLKKQHQGLKVEETADRAVASAKARFVRTSWPGSPPGAKVTLIIIRGDTIYILAADSDQEGVAATRAAFDQMAGSIAWTR